jgi:hypothetical protein
VLRQPSRDPPRTTLPPPGLTAWMVNTRNAPSPRPRSAKVVSVHRPVTSIGSPLTVTVCMGGGVCHGTGGGSILAGSINATMKEKPDLRQARVRWGSAPIWSTWLHPVGRHPRKCEA